MDWYWWVLIAAGVVGIGYLKLVFFKKLQEKKKEKPNYKKEDE